MLLAVLLLYVACVYAALDPILVEPIPDEPIPEEPIPEEPLPEEPIPEGLLYPRPTETREVVSLDGLWNFVVSPKLDPLVGFRHHWYKNDLTKLSDYDIHLMPVPSSYNDITQNSDIRDHVGLVWYDRTFFVPHSWANTSRVWLRFSSVSYAAEVWVNGDKVMNHEIGHLPFQKEISHILKFGGLNRVTVACDNTLLQDTVPQGTVHKVNTDKGRRWVQSYTFDFFNYAGIHRPVTLFTTPISYVNDITIHTDIQGPTGIVNYSIAYVDEQEVTCVIVLLDKDGNKVAGDHGYRKGTLKVPSANLWWPYLMDPNPGYLYIFQSKKLKGTNIWINDDYSKKVQEDRRLLIPVLKRAKQNERDTSLRYNKLLVHGTEYGVESFKNEDTEKKRTVELRSNSGEVLDVYRLPIGIRTISWSSTALLINNRPAYLHGFGRHEDADIRGKGLDLPTVIRDYNLIKWVGGNAYRTSHYPYADEIMDLADQLGIMIIDECPSVNTDGFSYDLLVKHKQSLTELIRRDKNRPGVIMWSIANEPRTQTETAGQYFGQVADHVRSLDKTRPITIAENTGVDEDKSAKHIDIICFNIYNGWYRNPGHLDMITESVIDEATSWHVKHKKPVLITEYGADTIAGLHIYPQYVWSEEYQVSLMSKHFKAFDRLREKGWFIGEFIWNFADFKTSQKVGRAGGNRKGIFTRNRQPKASAHHLRRRYFYLAKQLYNITLPKDLLEYVAPNVYRDEL